MEKNKNGRFDVLHLGKAKWIEADEDWLNNVQLKGVTEIRFHSGRGNNEECLETIIWNGKSVYYENVYGSWCRR